MLKSHYTIHGTISLYMDFFGRHILGLFNLLHHLKFEKIPFKARLDFAKTHKITKLDEIKLNGLNQTIYWRDLDRFDYSKDDPEPPSYELYTIFSLQVYFIFFFVWKCIQLIVIYLTKKYLSWGFKEEEKFINKCTHVLNTLNGPLPYNDWDETLECHDEPYTINRFKKQFR